MTMKSKNRLSLIFTFGLFIFFANLSCKSNTDVTPVTSITEFIKNNPERSSFVLLRNDSIKIQLRQDNKFPLASTLKIIVAVEFSKQVASGKINPVELIDIANLDLYYIPNTDGDQHPNWKKSATTRNELINNRVSLREVAKGMIWFSSNANTEYLMDRLGLDKININLKELNLPNHDNLSYIVSSLFVYSTNNKAELIKKLNTYSTQDFEKEYTTIHEKLKTDIDGTYKKQFTFPDQELQKFWSDRLPASTTKEYASVMQKILSQNYYSAPVQKQLDIILQPFLESEGNRNIYDFFYSKGGNTGFILTYAIATKIKNGSKTVMTVFFNNLTSKEQEQLSGLLNTFLINCTQGEKYKDIINAL